MPTQPEDKTSLLEVPPHPVAYDKTILENVSWYYGSFHSHHDVAVALKDKHPYTITVLIELLNYKLRNKKEYVKKTYFPRASKYKQILYEMFSKEFRSDNGHSVYGEWLKKYRPLFTIKDIEKNVNVVDDYIIEHELEPRYKQKILARFKNYEKLFKERREIHRERRYNLPEPLDHLDRRNPFDTIFVWEENGKKIARKGGSGSSGSRETNSKFIYGLLELNKIQPVPSYIFVYSENNELLFVKKFESLCIPEFDVGSNYNIDRAEAKELEQGGKFLQWGVLDKISKIKVGTK